MKINMKFLKLVTLAALTISVFVLPSLRAADSNEDGHSERASSYFNFGVGQEFRVEGYDSGIGLSRDSRTQFSIELGSKLIALPLTYSYGQKINIFGFKPRLQYLVSIDSNNIFQIGPGVGGILNYWYASQSVLGHSVDLNSLELGAQLSAHLKLNLLPNFNILISPALIDFNLYRTTWVDTHSPFGNFTDDDNSRGILYSFAVSAGLSF